jgi:hypothetical protein
MREMSFTLTGDSSIDRWDYRQRKKGWPGEELLQFAKPSDTDSRATINAFPFATETKARSKVAA